MKDLVEIRWHGRGGQGAKTAALLLADVAFSTGMHVQGFPEYGPERMGAPITAYNRLSNDQIRVHSNIYNPDYVVVVDETLLDSVDVTEGLKENGRISFLAKSENRPASPSDLNLSPKKEWLLPTYVMDGEILYENLLHSGKDEEWLKKQLSAHGCKCLSDVFLATGNQQNTLNVYLKNNRSGSSVIKE